MSEMRYLAYLLVLLALPMAAPAADLVFEFQGQGNYDSNVFRRSSDVKDDFLFRLRPGVRLEERHGHDLNYSLRYLAPIELSVDNSDRLDSVDHYGDANFSYKPSGRLEFYGSDAFRYQHGTLLSFATLETGTDNVPSVDVDSRARVTTNTATAGVRYQLTRNLEADFSIQHQLFETTQESRQDNWMLNLNPNFLYRVHPRLRVGMGVAYSHQNFDSSNIAVGSEVNIVNAYAQASWAITPTSSLQVQAGPTYIHIHEDDAPTGKVLKTPVVGIVDGVAFVNSLDACPFLDPADPDDTTYIPASGCSVDLNALIPVQEGTPEYAALFTEEVDLQNQGDIDESDDTVDVFAQVVLTSNWTPDLSSTLAYRRKQGTASGLGGTVISDSVSGAVNWNFRQRWGFTGSASWVNRESVADVPEFFRLAGPSGIIGGAAGYTGEQLVLATSSQRVEVEMWNVSARLSNQIFRKTRVFGQVTYTDQDAKSNSIGGQSNFEDWLVFVGVRHEFEPIGLW